MRENHFSFRRFWAILIKEFIHFRRDRTTLALMFFLPLLQLVLFGYAINFDPRGLPTALVAAKETPYTRSLLAAFQQSSYFQITHSMVSEETAETLMRTGKVQFIVSIPSDFSKKLLHNQRPAILLQSDATDPSTTTPALAAFNILSQKALQHDLNGPTAFLRSTAPPFETIIHQRYNPEGITQHNIVPGLTGLVLNMTMVMLAAMAITREFERGTMENLMAMPIRPLEIMIGKIIPFVVVGFAQTSLILLSAKILFGVPMIGNIFLIFLACIVFILASLSVGFTFSTVADNQIQASQMAAFFFLPSLMLSGFSFPFRGMPVWAQNLGEILPLTHFLRIIRGTLLKGNTFLEIWPNLWPMLVFMVVAITVAIYRYRMTLD